MAKKAEIEQTEIEAPYELPEGWKWCRLGDVCEKIKRGKSPKYTDKSKILVFAQKCNQPDGTMSLEKALFLNEELLSKYKDDDFVKDGDILINSTGTGTIGRVGYFDKALLPEGMKLVPDTHVTTVRACADNASKFFYYFIKQKESYLELKGVGTTNMKELHADVLENLSFPLPPTLAEQKRIVNRIESMFAKLDEAKEKAQAVLDNFETRKAAILHKAFTGELTANWRKEHGVPDDSWEEKIVGDLLFPMTTKMPSGKIFRYIDIDAIDNEKQIVRCPKIIDVEKAPSRASRELKKNDVLFSMVRPYLKNIALIDKSLSDCIASTGFYVCRCKLELNHLYLYNFLCSKDAIDYLMQFMKGDNSPSIRKDDLLTMPFRLPTLPEQLEIVRILDSMFEKENRAKEASQCVLEQITLLKKSILSRAFRGEL